ncbi:Uncharacterised protein [Salmonella enterica subsp. enterica serovar Bovismorbificans]|uniref:Uncharacterized protein n=1 Tax=Salmonella enterica subsp. enterica serovar Bovismorbificans TaxID=58097 RepID=A0A655CLB3_SALET|nr:Uncharacterised protein [Salmonella enterica subsp. enterica serovar Bovismorbificans]
MFQHGHQIGQDLCGVKFIGQAVPDGNARVFPQLFHNVLTKSAIFDAVIHPPQDASSIFHGLFMADLRAAWAEINHLRALVERGDFKRASGAGRGFFKNQRDVFADQCLLFASGFFCGFQLNSQIDEVLDFRRGVVKQLQKVTIFQ